ncbi:MAG: siphovirus ReqiPepy6 Gp37-like family protein [Clostridia bacterium]
MATVMLMNADFTLAGELPQYTGLTLKREFSGVGSFRLTLARGMPGWALLARGVLLYPSDAPWKMLIAEKVTVTEKQVTVEGVPLKGLAKRRVAVPPNVAAAGDVYQAFGWDRFSGDAQSAYLHYAAANLTAPADPKRAFARMVTGAAFVNAPGASAAGEALPWQARFDKLHELFGDIGEATGVGWDIRPDFAAKRFVFAAWAGADRRGTAATQAASTAPAAVLSRQMGNVDETTLVDDESAAVSTSYGGGAGEDENRLILSVGNEAIGFERREGWTEVSGASDAALLRMGAQRKLASPKLTLTAGVTDSGLCRYGRDYEVGDRLVVVADGQRMETRLTAMEEVYERGTRQLRATFGDAPVTLTSRMNGGAKATVW